MIVQKSELLMAIVKHPGYSNQDLRAILWAVNTYDRYADGILSIKPYGRRYAVEFRGAK